MVRKRTGTRSSEPVGASGAVCAFRIDYLLAPWTVAADEIERGSRETGLGALGSVGDGRLIRGLMQVVPNATFSLRYVFDPGSDPSLKVYLVVRVPRVPGSDGAVGIPEVASAVQNLLAAYVRSCYFVQVSSDEELVRACRPFRISSGAEITRREAIISIASWDTRPSGRRPLGFGVDESAPTAEDTCEREDVQYVYPFIPTSDPMRRVCELLLRETAPCVVDVSWRPWVLSGPARDSLERSLQTCERYLQDLFVQSGRTVLRQRCELLRNWFHAQLQTLGAVGNAVLLRVMVASSGPRVAESPVVSAVGEALTAPLKVEPDGRVYSAGGYDVLPVEGSKIEKALEDVVVEEPPPRHPLLHVFDTVAAESLFKFPYAASDTFPGLPVRSARHLDAPRRLPTRGCRMGRGYHSGEVVPVLLPRDDHRRHVYTIGQTGTGKSTLLLRMIMDQIRQGEGVGVVDPHGDLVRMVLDRVPNDRLDDVILFDPADAEFPIGLNLLDWRVPEEKAFLADEFISMLRLLFADWTMGPMFFHNVRFAVLLLMSGTEDPGTLVEVPYLFVDPDFHKGYLKRVDDPLVYLFWNREFPKLNYAEENFLQYIISKFDPFITHPLLRNVIGQRRSSLDFDAIINDGKILLVDLAKGKLGEQNSYLLGMIVMAKLYAAAMRRIAVERGQRRDFFLYVDEFQNLATETFASMLSEARKFRLNVTLANQYIAQVPQGIAGAVLGNVGTVVVFRVGVMDAKLLEPVFAPWLTQEALSGQPNYHAYLRLTAGGEVGRPISLYTELEAEVGPDADLNRERVVAETRRRYGRPKAEVEAEIRCYLGWKEAELHRAWEEVLEQGQDEGEEGGR